MAHFRGIVQGSGGPATRNAGKGAGLRTTAASWQGSVRTHLYHDEESGRDMARVSLEPWQGVGVSRVLYDGPVDGEEV